MQKCQHLEQIKEVTPNSDGCEDCLKIGSSWVHLRLCRVCGHVGCCDSSSMKHASAHYKSSAHAIISSFEPNEEWAFCYPDQLFFESLPAE